MLSDFGPMVGLCQRWVYFEACWTILGLCWAYVGFMLGLRYARMLGPYWAQRAHVGWNRPMLGHVAVNWQTDKYVEKNKNLKKSCPSNFFVIALYVHWPRFWVISSRIIFPRFGKRLSPPIGELLSSGLGHLWAVLGVIVQDLRDKKSKTPKDTNPKKKRVKKS